MAVKSAGLVVEKSCGIWGIYEQDIYGNKTHRDSDDGVNPPTVVNTGTHAIVTKSSGAKTIYDYSRGFGLGTERTL
jgi:hypothetical protein